MFRFSFLLAVSGFLLSPLSPPSHGADRKLTRHHRGLVKALGAATVGSESHKHALLPPAEQERKHVFGHLSEAFRRSHSDERKEGGCQHDR